MEKLEIIKIALQILMYTLNSLVALLKLIRIVKRIIKRVRG